MSEVSIATLGEVSLKITKGTTPPKGQGFVDKGINYIKSDAISYSGRIDKEKFVAIDQVTHHKFKRSHLQKGDILFSMAGAYLGKSGIVTEDMLPANTNQAIAIIRLNPQKALSEYVGFYLRQKSIIEYVNNMSGQSAQPNINFQEIASIEFPLPAISEQKAIASTLSSLDDKIDLLHGQNTTLEKMAETLFRQWFVEKAREDWEEVQIGSFVKTNAASIGQGYPQKQIKYLDTGSLTQGNIENIQSMALIDAPSRARRLVRHNDILISTVRPDQKHYGIVKNPTDDLVVSTGFCVITCDKIDPHFIYLFLTSDDMTDYLHSIAEGSTSTYPSLKPSDIESLTFMLPPKDSLDSFSALASPFWDKIDKNQTQIRTLTSLRDALLPKLMSGEVKIAN